MNHALLALIATVWISGCSSAPYYRVFRGAQRADLPTATFRAKLAKEFIPALPATHSKNGLLAYLPALPPEGVPKGFPEELALVVYESESRYRAARETPEGKRYAEQHWDVFDRARTKTGGPVRFEGKLDADVGYDVLQRAIDWNQGESFLLISMRVTGDTASFLTSAAAHVRETAKSAGLLGYVVVSNGEWLVEFQNWKTASSSVLVRVDWAELSWRMAAREFEGTIAPGQFFRIGPEPDLN